MVQDLPKRVKRLIREHAAAAHEEELRRALLPLAEAFKRWGEGQIGSGELSELIHEFHQGPARELWVRYNPGSTSRLDIPVAHAIVTGVLDRKKVPAELLEHCARAIAFYEEQEARS